MLIKNKVLFFLAITFLFSTIGAYQQPTIVTTLPSTCSPPNSVYNSTDKKYYDCYTSGVWGERLVAGSSKVSLNNINYPSCNNGQILIKDSSLLGWKCSDLNNNPIPNPTPTPIPTIIVVDATYGANIAGILKGNVTKEIVKACTGKTSCSYIIDYTQIGDPAPDKLKNFVVNYTCNGTPKQVTIPAEAGLGNNTLRLVCP